MAYPTSGLIGARLATVKAGTTTDGEGAEFSLGTITLGTDGTEWMYVQAGAAITQYDTVVIDENYQAQPITHTLGATGQRIGWAQVAFSDNDLGWVAIGGTNISATLGASCAADARLYTNTTAGVLDDASQAGAIVVNGVVAVTAVATNAAAVEIIAHNAHLTT